MQLFCFVIKAKTCKMPRNFNRENIMRLDKFIAENTGLTRSQATKAIPKVR